MFYKFPWIVCPRLGVSCNAAALLSLPAGAVGIWVKAFATNIKCAGALQGSTFWGTSGHPSVGGRAPGISVVSCPPACSAVGLLLGWLAGCLLCNRLCSEKRGGQCSHAVRAPGMCMTWGSVLRISSAGLCPSISWAGRAGGAGEQSPGLGPALRSTSQPAPGVFTGRAASIPWLSPDSNRAPTHLPMSLCSGCPLPINL